MSKKPATHLNEFLSALAKSHGEQSAALHESKRLNTLHAWCLLLFVAGHLVGDLLEIVFAVWR